jgi:serine protease Do
MTKSQTTKIVLISVAISILINLFFGRLISAQVSTWPLLNKFKIISPQTPIIINTREQVRVDNSTDIVQVFDSIKSKLGTLLVFNNNQITGIATAINLTSDGLFVSSKEALLNAKAENLKIKLDDGSLIAINKVILDPATNLALLEGRANNISVANFGSSKNLVPAERVVLVGGSLLNFTPDFSTTFVSASQKNDFGNLKSSDFPGRGFQIQFQNQMPDGVLVNMKSEIVGILDSKGAIVSSDIIKDFTGGFLSKEQELKRIKLGFRYKNLSEVEAQNLKVPFGAKVIDVSAGGSSQKGGLLPGDIIFSFDNEKITVDKSLEEIVQKYKPADKVNLTVYRNGQNVTLSLTAGNL